MTRGPGDYGWLWGRITHIGTRLLNSFSNIKPVIRGGLGKILCHSGSISKCEGSADKGVEGCRGPIGSGYQGKGRGKREGFFFVIVVVLSIVYFFDSGIAAAAAAAALETRTASVLSV